MNKKGDSILLVLFEVLAVVLIAFTMIRIAQGFASSETVIKQNTAQDIALMVNTLVGVPGDAIVEYPANLSNYNLVMDSTSITLKSISLPELKKPGVDRTAYFYLPNGYTAGGILEAKSRLCLEKKSKSITLGECHGP